LANLPFLKDQNTYVYESGAIAVYLAYKAQAAHLLGVSCEEQIANSQIKGIIEDLKKNSFPAFFLP
jgi:glutathione S-transferase